MTPLPIGVPVSASTESLTGRLDAWMDPNQQDSLSVPEYHALEGPDDAQDAVHRW
jgi:hypothetical protein